MKETKRMATSWATVGGLAGAILALLLFLDLFDPWRSTLLWREVFNFGHVPLFGVVSVLLLRLTRAVAGHRLSILIQYALAFTVAGCLAALSEAVQIAGPRDADLLDFLSDILGVVSFLLIHLAEDRNARSSFAALAFRRSRTLIRIAGMGIILFAAIPLIQVASAWVSRNNAYPTLFTFEHRWENTFIFADNATAMVRLQPRDVSTGAENHVLRVDYRAETYTGLILQDLYPDWSEAGLLGFGVTSLSTQPEYLMLRVEDVLTMPGTHDRYEQVIELKPGQNEFSIPLSQITRSRQGRLLDTGRIKRIVLFSASEPRRDFSVEFDNFILE